MKKKYYILIAIAAIAAVFFGIPFYYYKKGYTISQNANNTFHPVMRKQLRQENGFQRFRKFVLQYWLYIVPKNADWKMHQPPIIYTVGPSFI